jgi:hypothetical protein
VESGAITEEIRETIQKLLDLHIATHGGDQQQSLISLSSATASFTDPSNSETVMFGPAARGSKPQLPSFGDYEIIEPTA